MKKYVIGLILLLLTTVYVLVPPNRRGDDALRYLERHARAYPTIQARGETTSNNDFYWQAIRTIRVIQHDLGGSVTFGDMSQIPPDALGITDTATRHIMIVDALSWTSRYEVLTHEGGHLLSLGGLDTHGDNEVFAEGISGAVLWHDGDMAGVQRSIAYLAWFKSSLHVLDDYRSDIYRAARMLEGR